MQTQWRIVAGMGGAIYSGLDYAAMTALMDVYEIDDRREALALLRLMEHAAMQVLNRKKA